MPQIILGIDPGIGRTGYAFLSADDKDDQNLLDYGCIKTPAKTPISKRLMLLHNELSGLINKRRPDKLAIEKLFFNTNAKTAIIVGQAMGAILLTAGQNSLPVEEVTPLQVKTALTGYGRADKRQVQQMVMGLLKLEEKPTPDDAADAIAVALTSALTKHELYPNRV